MVGAAREQGDRLADMTCGGSKLRPALGLKPQVRLAEIVERGEHAKPASRDRIQVVAPGQPRQTPANGRDLEQGFEYRSDVGAVVDERMPGDDATVLVFLELRPERSWSPLHACPL